MSTNKEIICYGCKKEIKEQMVNLVHLVDKEVITCSKCNRLIQEGKNYGRYEVKITVDSALKHLNEVVQISRNEGVKVVTDMMESDLKDNRLNHGYAKRRKEGKVKDNLIEAYTWNRIILEKLLRRIELKTNPKVVIKKKIE